MNIHIRVVPYNAAWPALFREEAGRLADILKEHLELDQVNVKATTEEGLGFTGHMEGISAQAICSISQALDFGADDRMGSCPGCGGCAR